MADKDRRDELPTLTPEYDVEAFARESEHRLAQTGGAPRTSGAYSSMTIPKASPTGIPADDDPTATVPVISAREDVTELLELPTESFVLAFIDGARDVDQIAKASGLPRDLVAVTVSDLVKCGVVTMRRARR